MSNDTDHDSVDARAIRDLYERLDRWEQQGHTTVQIAAVRRHLDTRVTR